MYHYVIDRLPRQHVILLMSLKRSKKRESLRWSLKGYLVERKLTSGQEYLPFSRQFCLKYGIRA